MKIDRNKETNDTAQAVNVQESNANLPKEMDDLWEKIWKDLGINAEARTGDSWQRVVETSKKEDPRELLEGQKFQDQGQ